MSLVPVYEYDDVPHDGFEKFGHVLNKSELDPFFMNLLSVSSAVLEAKEALALKVRDGHCSFLGVMCPIEGLGCSFTALVTCSMRRCWTQFLLLERCVI